MWTNVSSGLSKYIFAFGLVVLSTETACQSIRLSWGLENRWAYGEEQADPEEIFDHRQAKKSRALRMFWSKATHHEGETFALQRDCSVRKSAGLAEYKKLYPNGEPRVEAPSAEYIQRAFKDPYWHYNEFSISRDPYCTQAVKRLAPSLYFDFVGTPSTQEFVLQAIDITTLRYMEYKGGGFSQGEEWYDIRLHHRPGSYQYLVDESKLVFAGHGRVVLRFWSDNFYPSAYSTPLGMYLISVRFVFLSGQQAVAVETGKFLLED